MAIIEILFLHIVCAIIMMIACGVVFKKPRESVHFDVKIVSNKYLLWTRKKNELQQPP